MNTVTEKACAKINICLDVTGIREDGYHSIESVMLCVTLADDVTVEKTDDIGITLECSRSDLPTGEKNLAYKAAAAFYEYIEENPRVHIKLIKNIPDQAGLAGGSADAAAVLRALNTLTGACLSDETLRKIAEGIGSDVIFCVSSDPSFVSGRGEIIDYCAPLPECTVLLAKGNSGVKTPGAYRSLDVMYGDYSKRGGLAKKCFDAMYSGGLDAISESAFNIFEEIVIPNDPEISLIKDEMKRNGASLSLMSGSGSAVFGLYRSESDARLAQKALREKGFFAEVCKPL